MPLPQSPDYQEMQQGVDRITSILQQQSQPRNTMNFEPQASPLSPNMLNLVQSAATSYGIGDRPPSFLDVLTKTQESVQKQQYGAQDQLLQAYEAKLKLGDRQTKALDDKINMFVGDDPEAKSIILQELNNLPDDIDPTSADTYIKIAGIAKKHGLTNIERQLKLGQEQAKIDLLGAQTEAAKALGQQRQTTSIQPKPSQLQKTLSNKIAEDVQTVNQDASNIRTIESSVNELDNLLKGGLSTGKLSKGIAAFDIGNVFQNTRDLQKMEQLVNTIALPKTASLKGATSDKDVKFVKDAFANAGTSNEANEFAINVAKRFVQRQKAIIETYNDMIAEPTYSANPELFYRDLQKQINSLPSLEEEVKGASTDVMSDLPNPSQHKGRVIKDTDTGQKYISNGSEWIPQ